MLLVEDYIDGKLHAFDKDWPELPFAHREHIGCTVDYVAGRNRYMGYLISLGIYSFKGVKVGLDCANGSSWNIAKSVFDALGTDTYVINAQPNGTNINNNAGSTHIEGLQKFVVEKGLDIGFAYDGDADRCLCVDEKGNVITGDHILYIYGCYMKERGKLLTNINATLFSTYLCMYPKEALTNLATVLSPYITDVTPANLHDRCADLFRRILDDLVGFTREPTQLSLASVVNTTLSPTIVENYGTRLLLETHGFCPYKGCTNELHEVTSSGTAEPTYALTLIDTMKRPSYENIIALCPACHARYLAEQESGFYETSLAFLQQKKQELMIEETANSILSQHEIEAGVDRLLRKIQDNLVELSDDELEELKLNYDPVKVRQKIPGNDLEQKMLRTKVLRNVRAYFNLVDQNLKNLNKEGIIRQRVFSFQVRNLFIDFDETTIDGMSLSQTVIFDILQPAFALHNHAHSPLRLLEHLCRNDLVCTVIEVVAVVPAAIDCHDRMCAILLIDGVTILISRELCAIHHGSGGNYWIHLHELCVFRQLLLDNGRNRALQLTQRDVCVDSQVLDSLCHALHCLR